MIKKISLIFTILLFFSCNSQKNINELKNHFDRSQINDLKKLTNFVIDEVSLGKDFKSSLMGLEKQIAENGYEIIINRIDYQKQVNVINAIQESTYNEIWTECLTTIPKKNIESKVLCTSGSEFEYQKYLHELGKRIPFVKEYSEKLESSGDLGYDYMFWNYYLNPESKIDHSDFNSKLIFTIHLLTLNDQLNK